MTTKCSCIVCKKEFSIKGFHSHFARSHTPEGNEKTKQYGKLGAKIFIENNKDKIQSKKENFRLSYYHNPNYCLQCNNPLSYKQKHNKFCSISCSASYNNNERIKNGYTVSQETREKLSILGKNQERPPYSKISFCKNCNCTIKYSHNKTCSKKCYSELMSKHAKKIPQFGGNKNNRAYGWYESIFAGKVWLESSYEYKVAKELDENHIHWVRPKGLKYELDGKIKTYFPDFYLTDYDIYLDPKNDYLIPLDTLKINTVIEQQKVNIIILTKDQLDWKSILSII